MSSPLHPGSPAPRRPADLIQDLSNLLTTAGGYAQLLAAQPAGEHAGWAAEIVRAATAAEAVLAELVAGLSEK